VDAQVHCLLLRVLLIFGFADAAAWDDAVAADAVALDVNEVVATQTGVNLLGIVVPLIPSFTDALTVAEDGATLVAHAACGRPRALHARVTLARDALEGFFVQPVPSLAHLASASSPIANITVAIVACQALAFVVSVGEAQSVAQVAFSALVERRAL
jgi:hypothetical protein